MSRASTFSSGEKTSAAAPAERNTKLKSSRLAEIVVSLPSAAEAQRVRALETNLRTVSWSSLLPCLVASKNDLGGPAAFLALGALPPVRFFPSSPSSDSFSSSSEEEGEEAVAAFNPFLDPRLDDDDDDDRGAASSSSSSSSL